MNMTADVGSLNKNYLIWSGIMKNFDFEYISELIYKKTVGSISEEEERILQDWIEKSPKNRQLYNKLSNTSYLHVQYQKWRVIKDNAEVARTEMKRRIHGKGGNIFLWFKNIAAVAAVALISILSYHLYDSNKKYKELLTRQETLQYFSSIHHGETKATLTTDSGKKVVLGNSQESNEKAIKSLYQEKKSKPEVIPNKEEDRIALNNLEIPSGGEFHIILEDSTEVWLNAESSLKYPEYFTESSREVEISGEAYFKVAKDAKRPFYVKSAGNRIKVYGTEFNISSYADEECVYTTLVKGSISLQPQNSNDAELFLTPGHQAIFAKADSSTSITTIKTDVITSWKDGMFVFEDKTLAQIMKSLARWYDFSYEFANEKVANTVFMGRIPRYGKFGDVLEILEKSGNLRFEVTKNQIMISNR